MKSTKSLNDSELLGDENADGQRLSGREKGDLYFKRVAGYLTTRESFPVGDDGVIAVTLLAEELNVPTQSMYKNRNIRALLDSESRRLGLGLIGSCPTTKKTTEESLPGPAGSRLLLCERRVHKLEQQNAALVAENADLRQQLKAVRLTINREDMIIETGRRVADPLSYR